MNRSLPFSLSPYFMMIAIALVACQPSQNREDADRSFIVDEPCRAPCWYGIMLDGSTREDVYRTLARLPFVDQATVKESPVEYSWIDLDDEIEVYYSCTYLRHGICGGVVIAGDHVKSIWHWIAYPLTLSDMVGKLGEPSYWSCFPVPGERPRETAVLYWPELRIIAEASSRSCPVEGGRLQSTAQVDALEYAVNAKFAGPNSDPVNWPRWIGFIDD